MAEEFFQLGMIQMPISGEYLTEVLIFLNRLVESHRGQCLAVAVYFLRVRCSKNFAELRVLAHHRTPILVYRERFCVFTRLGVHDARIFFRE